jgi:hypothetical protein
MLLRIALIAALALPVFAHDDDYRNNRDRRDRDDYRYNRNRDRRNDQYRYGNNRGYGYGNNSGYGYGSNSGYGYGNGSTIIDRTMRDLQSAASRSRVDGHERDHFNRAMSELQNMRYSGGTDYRRLDRVIEDLDHLSRADQINPRDRQILARDRQALYSLRGSYSNSRW